MPAIFLSSKSILSIIHHRELWMLIIMNPTMSCTIMIKPLWLPIWLSSAPSVVKTIISFIIITRIPGSIVTNKIITHHHYTVSLICDVPVTFTTIIFCAWICSETNPSEITNQNLDIFMTNWQLKLSQVPVI